MRKVIGGRATVGTCLTSIWTGSVLTGGRLDHGEVYGNVGCDELFQTQDGSKKSDDSNPGLNRRVLRQELSLGHLPLTTTSTSLFIPFVAFLSRLLSSFSLRRFASASAASVTLATADMSNGATSESKVCAISVVGVLPRRCGDNGTRARPLRHHIKDGHSTNNGSRPKL